MHVRGAGVDDADALAAMHERCSMDTIFRRYLCAAHALSRAWQLRLLATTVALVAVDAHGRVHALGNIGRLDDAGTAELAVLVEDSFQGRGLGTAVVRHLAAAARLAGFRALRADVLPSSIAAMRAAAHLGPAASVVGHGVVTLTIPLRVEAVAGLSVA